MSIENLYRIQEKLAFHFSKLYHKEITREDTFWALFLLLEDKGRIEWATDLWDLDLEYDQCLQLLLKFDFDCLHSPVISTKDLIPNRFLLQFKVRLKFKGQIWVIHRYDADPLPSNPHAHCLEQNIKLDLSNGNCFRKKKFLFRISEKDLLSIRELANDVYKGNLPPLAIQTKDCEQNEGC